MENFLQSLQNQTTYNCLERLKNFYSVGNYPTKVFYWYLEFPVLNQVVGFVPMCLDEQTFDSHPAICHIPLRSFSQWPDFCVYSQSH